jgi:hypothetical protein
MKTAVLKGCNDVVSYKHGNILHKPATFIFTVLQNFDDLLPDYMEPQPRKPHQLDVHNDVRETMYLKTEATCSSKTLAYFYHTTCFTISATLFLFSFYGLIKLSKYCDRQGHIFANYQSLMPEPFSDYTFTV